MEFRDKIEQALKEIDQRVYYGKIPESVINDEWNYFVFGKSTLKPTGKSNISLVDNYWIGIVREDDIPDDLVYEVIDKLNSLPGLKLTSDDGEYEYIFKNKTDLVVEVLTLSFAKVKKCGNLCQ